MACAECDRIEEAAEREMDIFEKRIAELEAEVERLKKMGKTYLKQLHQAAKVEKRLISALRKTTVSDKVIEQALKGDKE